MSRIRTLIPTVLARSNLRYLMRDLFSTDRTAGAVNNTPAEPGPGTRTVTDTGNQVSIANGAVRLAGVCQNNDPYLRYASVPRAAGTVGYAKFKIATGKRMSDVGWMTAANATAHSLWRTVAESGGVIQPVSTSGLYLLDSVWHEMWMVQRTSGFFLYLNYGNGPRLVFVTATGNGTPLVWGSRGLVTYDQDASFDAMHIEELPWIPAPLVSDSFNRANGAPGSTDGAGASEAGGAGAAWTDQAGVSAIATNALGFSALTGGVGIATVDAGTDRVFVQVDVTRTAGNAGVVFWYTDTNNYARAYHDGTNVKVEAVVGGSVVGTIAIAATYSAGKSIKVALSDFDAIVFYGDTKINQYQKFTGLPLGATKYGVYSTDTGNTFDNFVAWDAAPAGVGRTPALSLPRVHCLGDSISAGYGALSGALHKKFNGAYVAVDNGLGGQTTAQIAARLTQQVINQRPACVVILAGVNDAKSSIASATIQANLQAMYTAAHNAGIRVVAVTITPWKNGTNWTEARQTITDEVNAWILNTATNVDYRIDAYTALEDPGAPDALLAAYDSGDHTHPSAAGYTALATAIYNGAVW